MLSHTLPRVIAPEIDSLLSDEEIDLVALKRIGPERPKLQELSDSPVMLELPAVGECFRFWVSEDGTPESDSELAERLFGELQSWISETKFGWGTLRERR
jgi:hypothetical protein